MLGKQRGYLKSLLPLGYYLILLCSQFFPFVQEKPPALSVSGGCSGTLHTTENKRGNRETLPQSNTWEVSLSNLPVSQLWRLICSVSWCASGLLGKVIVSGDKLQRKVTWGDKVVNRGGVKFFSMLWIFVFLQKPVATVQQYPCRNLTAEPKVLELVVFEWLGPFECALLE